MRMWNRAGWLLFILSTSAVAASNSSLEALPKLQESLEARLTGLVRSADPRALVLVRFRPREESIRLPMTPLVLHDQSIQNGNGNFRLGRINVTVLTAKANLPKGMEDLVREVCQEYSETVGLQIKALPGVVAESETPAATPATANRSSVIQSNVTESKFFPAALALLAGALLLCTGLVTLVLSRQTNKFVKGLRAGAKKMASAFEAGGSSGGVGFSSAAPSSVVLEGQTTSRLETGAENIYAQLSEKAWLALFTDCYWSERDDYAAYLWQLVPFAQRKTLLSSANFLPAYAAYLVGVTAKDSNRANEPYYLSPLAIHRVSNAHLTDLVRKHPNLLSRLSSLRLEGLTLSPKERIVLSRSAGQDAPVPDFSSTVSLPRTLTQKLGQVTFRNFDEEREVLAMTDLALEIIEKLPSLGWLARLSAVERAKVLDSFSAKDLAQAWIGPPELLSAFAKEISKKKFQLMSSYLEKTPASRQSAAYLTLHIRVVELMKVNANPGSHEKSSLKMAA